MITKVLMKSIEIFADEQTACGESPLWDKKANRLLWVDNERGFIFARGANDETTTVLSSDYPAFALAHNDDGKLIIAGPKGIGLQEEGATILSVLDNHDGGNYLFNDVLASAVGGLYAGSFHWGEDGMERSGCLYHISPNGQAEVMDEGFRLSNGLGLSPDNNKLYFADTMEHVIYAYDVKQDGRVKNRRVFARISQDDGLPDGITVDESGFIWCACFYGGQVMRFDPEGVVERRIAIPAKQVTSMIFGGEELTDLFITTAGAYWSGKYQPTGFDPQAMMGGAVYKVETGIKGKPEHKCCFRT